MFGSHPIELIIVLVAALLIFGPKRLPEMGSTLGRGLNAFKKGYEEIKNPNFNDDEDDDVRKQLELKRQELENIEREQRLRMEIEEKRRELENLEQEISLKRATLGEMQQQETEV
jgi:sec-independent protein translocase protein TatA